MPYYIKFIIASFIISLFGLLGKANRKPVLMLFSAFLLITAIVEYTGWNWSRRYISTQNLYNYFTLFEVLFFLFFFYSILPKRRTKRLIILAMIVHTLAGLAGMFVIQREGFQTYTYMLGCAFLVVFSIVYFSFLLRFPDDGSLARNPYFWISIGILFYFTGSFALNGLTNVIAESMKHYNRVLRVTGDLLNIVEYSLFSIGFLCRIKLRKSSSL